MSFNCGARRAPSLLLGAGPVSELMRLDAVYRRLEDACTAAGGQAAWAARHGLAPSTVCDVLNARRDPSQAMLRALGLAKVTRYAEVRRVNG